VERGSTELPIGTRLFGELWTAPVPEDEELAYVRFDRARVPNGPEFPVCIVSSNAGEIHVFERPGPGVIRTGTRMRAFARDRWPRTYYW
jgi:hypothetical protein